MIKVVVLARYREILGFSETELTFDEPLSLGGLLMHPCFVSLPKEALFAVNRQFVRSDQIINLGDEIAIMPPVSGG